VLEVPPQTQARLALLGLIAALAGLASVGFYLYALMHFGLDVPVEDDVELLRFLVERSAGGDAATSGWFALHNEHRPAVARAVFAGVATVQGHVDFRSVTLVGNAALLGLVALLCSWLPRGPVWPRIALAGPICVLLFSLQHWQAATWATGAAQNYPMLLCALAALGLLARPTPWRVLAGAALATLALFDMGAGLFAFVLGLGLLLRARAWIPAGLFAAWASLCLGFYFTGYARPAHHPSVFAALGDPIAAFDYGCSLLGAGLSFDDARVGWLARFGGLVMVMAFAIAVFDRRWRDEPEVFASLCFVGFALGSITAARFGFGLDQAFDSRYRIYSHVFMALLWISWLRQRSRHPDGAGARFGPAVAAALVFAAALNLASIPAAWQSMQAHRAFYAANMRDWGKGRTLIPGPAEYSLVVERALGAGLYVFPCDAVGVRPEDGNRYCAGE
jgi:hypothetical protein